MIIIGVTGGIGSGKTTFCKVWERLGAFVLYADDFAKNLMITDTELITQIRSIFGAEAYFSDGNLNREFLAKEAFGKDRVKELNAIVHPQVHKRVRELIEEKKRADCPVFLEESALLLNNGRPEIMDYVIMLKAGKHVRIQRTEKRDNTDAGSVQQRIEKQPDYEKLEHLCDYVIENTGSVEALAAHAEKIYNEIVSNIK